MWDKLAIKNDETSFNLLGSKNKPAIKNKEDLGEKNFRDVFQAQETSNQKNNPVRGREKVEEDENLEELNLEELSHRIVQLIMSSLVGEVDLEEVDLEELEIQIEEIILEEVDLDMVNRDLFDMNTDKNLENILLESLGPEKAQVFIKQLEEKVGEVVREEDLKIGLESMDFKEVELPREEEDLEIDPNQEEEIDLESNKLEPRGQVGARPRRDKLDEKLESNSPEEGLKNQELNPEVKLEINPRENLSIKSNKEFLLETKESIEGQDLIDQIVSKVSLEQLEDKTGIEIKLKPDSLGSMKLDLELVKGELTAKILVDNYRTKEIIEENIFTLQEDLEETGMEIKSFEVFVGNSSDFNRDQDESFNFFNYQKNRQKLRAKNQKNKSMDSLMDYESNTSIKPASLGENEGMDLLV